MIAKVERAGRDPLIEHGPRHPGADVVENRRQESSVHPSGRTAVLGLGNVDARSGQAVDGDLGVESEQHPSECRSYGIVDDGRIAVGFPSTRRLLTIAFGTIVAFGTGHRFTVVRDRFRWVIAAESLVDPTVVKRGMTGTERRIATATSTRLPPSDGV